MNSFLHQASFATGYWYYDRHRSVRLVILVGLAIDQIAQSGLSSLSVIYYSAQLFSCRSNILWISDDFENECAYYISKDSKLSLENSVLALIQSVLQTLNLNEEQCTLMGFSKGGSAALYYGLKFNFKNIIASCPQLHIGSYVSRHWPNVANNMMGNNYDQGDINILDNLIPDLLKNKEIKTNIFI
nr:accessory Sec system protein Asp2 [Klebsiella michiganensis]